VRLQRVLSSALVVESSGGVAGSPLLLPSAAVAAAAAVGDSVASAGGALAGNGGASGSALPGSSGERPGLGLSLTGSHESVPTAADPVGRLATWSGGSKCWQRLMSLSPTTTERKQEERERMERGRKDDQVEPSNTATKLKP
jgi:hypothetical protein